MRKEELKVFLKKFKEIVPKRDKESRQTKFDLDLNLKEKIDESKAGYNVAGLHKFKRFEFNQKKW